MAARFLRWRAKGLILNRIWGIALLGMLAGVIGWGGVNTVLEASNSMEFCVSCHVMRDTVFAEYQQSAHYRNASGVRATCPDCHVPRDWGHKVWRKLQAGGEVLHWALGSIDTPPKFEAKRHQLAVREWDRMRESDSRECRNCHSFDAMDFHKQNIRAARSMRDAEKAGKTCVECHRAIAHKMPDVTATHRRQYADLVAQAAAFRPQPGQDVVAVRALALGDGLGELAAGQWVRVAELADGKVRVDVEGWRREGSPTLLYTRQGQRIPLAILTEAGGAALSLGPAVEADETGQRWEPARVSAWVAADAFLPQTKPLWQVAERMVADNCALCHARPRPDAYSADAWIGHITTMKRMTPLSEAEAALLLAYVQAHAKEDVER